MCDRPGCGSITTSQFGFYGSLTISMPIISFCILTSLVVICFETSHVCFPHANPSLFHLAVDFIKRTNPSSPVFLLPCVLAGMPLPSFAHPDPTSVPLGHRTFGFCTCTFAQAEIGFRNGYEFYFLLFNSQKRLFWQKQVWKEQFKGKANFFTLNIERETQSETGINRTGNTGLYQENMASTPTVL